MQMSFVLALALAADGVTVVADDGTTIELADDKGSANLVCTKQPLGLPVTAVCEITNGFTLADRNKLRFPIVNDFAFGVS